MKIIQVPRRFVKSDWGGIETVILESCKRLLGLGHQTEILCPNALATRQQEVMDGVPVRRVPYFYPYWGLTRQAKRQLDMKGGNLFSFSLMRSLMNCPSLDLIHLHTGKRLGGIVRHVARKRRIPYIASLHGGVSDVPAEEASSLTAPTKGSFEWGKVLGWWVGSRRVLQDAAAVVCVGQKEQELTRKRFPIQRVVHLPNGVNVERFGRGDGPAFRTHHRIPGHARLILSVGRIDPQKNQLFSVRLLPELLKTEPTAHLVMIGHVTHDAYAERLRREISERHLEKHVTLIKGFEPDSRDLVDAYHAADMFFLPSRHEPFGIVILEAWAARLPVVASRVGGIRSLVSDGEDGILFEPDDQKEALCSVRSLLGNLARGRALACAGQQVAREKYGWDRITQELVNLYEEVLRENTVPT